MDEIQNLILQVQGQVALESLNKELSNERQNLVGLVKQLNDGTIGQAAFELHAQTLARRMVPLNDEIAKLNAQAKQFSGQSGLQLGYVMDDLVNTSGDWQRH